MELAEPLTWVRNHHYIFEYQGNKIWLEIGPPKILTELKEISRRGSGADLVVILKRKRDGVYVILAEGEAKSSLRLEDVEDGDVLFQGKWKKLDQSSTRTVKEVIQNRGNIKIFEIKINFNNRNS